MKRIFSILFLLLGAGCSDERIEPEGSAGACIETWRQLNRPVAEYRSFHPDGPILVFYTAEWGALGLVAQEYLREPRFLDLFQRFHALPLVADCTTKEGVAWNEFQRVPPPEGMWIHCFFLSRPSGNDSRIPVGTVSPDVLYESLKSELARFPQRGSKFEN